ncbi:hypothetical protein [Tardiphaga sp. 862_B3_N1_1]|uniref:hypothetical protein n=1 Tax=Tardiphaga sp. 862_B3_N1_1 TaxID=3240763 RepID=UPI003F893829
MFVIATPRVADGTAARGSRRYGKILVALSSKTVENFWRRNKKAPANAGASFFESELKISIV